MMRPVIFVPPFVTSGGVSREREERNGRGRRRMGEGGEEGGRERNNVGIKKKKGEIVMISLAYTIQ